MLSGVVKAGSFFWGLLNVEKACAGFSFLFCPPAFSEDSGLSTPSLFKASFHFNTQDLNRSKPNGLLQFAFEILTNVVVHLSFWDGSDFGPWEPWNGISLHKSTHGSWAFPIYFPGYAQSCSIVLCKIFSLELGFAYKFFITAQTLKPRPFEATE